MAVISSWNCCTYLAKGETAMPALTSEDQLIPRSTLRHRPIGSDVKLTEPPRIPRASLTQTHLQKPSTTTPVGIPVGKSAKAQSSPWQRLLLVGIGMGMIVAVLLVVVGQLLVGWIGTGLDGLHYGYPRTFQMDAVVGQGDSVLHPSHFLALNLEGQIEVIELPGGDAAHAKIYLGPHLYGTNASLMPVTLRFVDTQHDGHPEMIVAFQGEQLIFSNAQGSFHAPAGMSS
jgi:hypothetical protein